MMDKVSVGCIVYLIVVFERLQNHLKIYVNKVKNVTYVSLYISFSEKCKNVKKCDVKKISVVQLCIYEFYIISNIILNVMNESTVGT